MCLELPSCKPHGTVKIDAQVHLIPCLVIALLPHIAFTGSSIIMKTLRDISPLIGTMVKSWGARVRPQFNPTLTAYHLPQVQVP